MFLSKYMKRVPYLQKGDQERGTFSVKVLLGKVLDLKAELPEICPEMQVNEIHALYGKHHKVSSFQKSH